MTNLIPRPSISLRAAEDPGVFSFHISGGSINHAQLCENDELLRKYLRDNSGAKIKFGDVIWSAVYKYVPYCFWIVLFDECTYVELILGC